LRNSEKRVEFDPIIRTEYVSNNNAIQTHMSATKLTYDNKINTASI